jgi:hypothetical protein
MSNALTPQDANGSSGLLNFIERASRDPDFDVAKFGELLRMQRELVQEQARGAFNRAMAAAQAEMLPVIRDATNTHTNSKYARLETVDRAMRPIYTKHGFGVRFGSDVSPREGYIRIVCTVSHVGGYSETNYLDAPPDTTGSQGKANKTAVQAVGSSVSYLRRYLLAMVFNIVLADDDDDGAGGADTKRRDEQAARTYYGNGPKPAPHPLDEMNGTVWLRNLQALLRAAETRQAVVDVRGDHRVTRALNSDMPTLIRARVEDMFREAFDRFADDAPGPRPSDEKPETGATNWLDDPLRELLAEVATMDIIALDGLDASASWRARVKEATEFPPDEERLIDAITARKAALHQGSA